MSAYIPQSARNSKNKYLAGLALGLFLAFSALPGRVEAGNVHKNAGSARIAADENELKNKEADLKKASKAKNKVLVKRLRKEIWELRHKIWRERGEEMRPKK